MMKNLKNYLNYFSKALDSHFINAEALNTKAASLRWLPGPHNTLVLIKMSYACNIYIGFWKFTSECVKYFINYVLYW